MPDMWVDKFIRNLLWATLMRALVAAMVVSFVVFVQSREAAPQAADERTPYASVSPMIVGGTAVPNGKYPFMAALLACVLSTRVFKAPRKTSSLAVFVRIQAAFLTAG